MYVCICNAVTDGDIRQAYAEGACTMPALQEKTGVSTCCGCCGPVARKVLESCQTEDEQVVTIPVSAIASPVSG